MLMNSSTNILNFPSYITVRCVGSLSVLGTDNAVRAVRALKIIRDERSFHRTLRVSRR